MAEKYKTCKHSTGIAGDHGSTGNAIRSGVSREMPGKRASDWQKSRWEDQERVESV